MEVWRDNSKHFQSIDHASCTFALYLLEICATRMSHMVTNSWKETFIAPATSFSLFLSLLWAIQNPKQQTKQCCTLRLRGVILLKSMSLRLNIFNIFIDYFISIYYGLFQKRRDDANCQVHVWETLFVTCFKSLWGEGRIFSEIKCALLNPLNLP